MRKKILVLFLLFILPATVFADTRWGTVERVIDGDTVELESGTVVRLLGIDTPERGELYYEEASEYAETILSGERVRLESGKDGFETGYYGRLLAFIWIDGSMFQKRILRKGYSKLYEYYDSGDKYYHKLKEALEIAKDYNRGLWR